MSEANIIVLTAPSGAGKTTLARRVLDAFPEVRFSVSVTTRPPRPYEREGVHYHFVTLEAFEAHKAAGNLLEYEEVYEGRFYGTLRSEVERTAQEAPVLLDIDVKGAMRVKEIFGARALVIFIRPPSLEVLKTRLQRRKTESPAALQARLARAEEELGYADRCDAVVVNADLDLATTQTFDLVRTFIESSST